MGKLWHLMGPEEDRLDFDAVARLFGYEPDTFSRLVDQGFFPAPRGLGHAVYYTGDDVAAMTLLAGRWGPRKGQAAAPRRGKRDADDEPENPGK